MYYPTLIDISQKIKKVSLGVSATSFITEYNELYISGWVGEYKAKVEPNSSQLSKNSIIIDPLFSFPRKIFDEGCEVRLAKCGRTHTVAVVEMHPSKLLKESTSLSALNSRRASVLEHFEKNVNEPLPPFYIDTEIETPEATPRYENEIMERNQFLPLAEEKRKPINN